MKSVSLALLSLLLLPPVVRAQSAPEPPQIVVSGEGLVKGTPDQAWVSIGAESRSKTSKDAQQRNAQAMTAVQTRLAAFGIAKAAVKTTAIDLQLEFDYADGKQTPRGYLARNTVEVRVDDLARLGDVLDAVVASGATMIHGLRFDVKGREQLVTEALQLAVRNAMSKAQALATGSSRTIDRVLKIEEVSAGEPIPIMRQYAMAAKADASTPVAPGELEIRAQVRLSAAIK
ncbi:MAG TPA: SIMPL domain-containing protein [Vicinamibacterales bacterium]|nr:SIMPL domain-containing protein [Vicinamibacterales bacterium]